MYFRHLNIKLQSIVGNINANKFMLFYKLNLTLYYKTFIYLS